MDKITHNRAHHAYASALAKRINGIFDFDSENNFASDRIKAALCCDTDYFLYAAKPDILSYYEDPLLAHLAAQNKISDYDYIIDCNNNYVKGCDGYWHALWLDLHNKILDYMCHAITDMYPDTKICDIPFSDVAIQQLYDDTIALAIDGLLN